MAHLNSPARERRGTATTRVRPSTLAGALVWGTIGTGVLAWLVALPSLWTDRVDHRGLLFAADPLFLTSLLLLTVGFCLAIRFRLLVAAAAALLLSVLGLRLPTAIAVPLPLYSWTYKHFGVIDYISTQGGLAQGVDIYHSWPGMFAFFSWVGDLTGASPLGLALWFTPVYQVLLVFAVFVLARAWQLGTGPSLVAAFVAHAANWVAQDYFSPQALAMLLGVTVLALLAHVGSRHHGRGIGRPHRAAIWVALVVFSAVVVTHQLTPFWLLVVLVVAAAAGLLRPRWAVLVFVGVAVGYTMLNYGVVRSYGSLLSFNPLANAERNVQGGNPSYGQILTSWAGRFSTVLLWSAAATVLIRRVLRRGDRRRTLTLAAMAFGSFAVLLGQSYGGEAIFRVFLYSVPGCSLLIAPALHRWLTGGAKLRLTGVVASFLALVVLTATSAQAFYGAWFANRVDRDALDASVWIVRTASPETMILALAPGAPGRVVARYTEFARINRSFDGGVNAWDGWLGAGFNDSERVDRLTAGLVAEQQPTFVVITRQMKIYSDYYGLFPAGALDRFESQLLANPYWLRRAQTATLTVLELDLGAG